MPAKVSSSSGYTLIELLVVIMIIGILGTIAYVSISNTAGPRALERAVDEVKVLIRQAQSNATSATLCNSKASVYWKLEFNKNTQDTISLKCFDKDNQLQSVKDLRLTNARIEIINGIVPSCSGDGYPAYNFWIKFASVTGKITFESDSTSTTCKVSDSRVIEIKIKTQNVSPELEKTFKIDKGGGIDVN